MISAQALVAGLWQLTSHWLPVWLLFLIHSQVVCKWRLHLCYPSAASRWRTILMCFPDRTPPHLPGCYRKNHWLEHLQCLALLHPKHNQWAALSSVEECKLNQIQDVSRQYCCMHRYKTYALLTCPALNVSIPSVIGNDWICPWALG